MPDVLGELSPEKKASITEAITHHLVALQGSPGIDPVKPGDAQKGKKLYSTIGCVACHGLETEPEVPLGSLSQKYHLASLVDFLKDPLKHRPSGRMPNMSLGHFEAVDLATYLLRDRPASHRFEVVESKAKARAGRQYFAQYGCANCHDHGAADKRAHKPMNALRPDQGCLSGRRGAWPAYGLDEGQTLLLRHALRNQNTQLPPSQQLELRLAQMNCIACHERGSIGRPIQKLNPHFTGSDPNLGEQGRLPPTLTGVGAKLKRSWLRKVLVGGEVVRPYLHTRMPIFGRENVAGLAELFSKVDVSKPVEIVRLKDAKQAKDDGRMLVGNRGLNCVACHTFRLESAAPIKALDLTTMSERLQESWFHRYLIHPQNYQPLTIMPSFWPSGKAVRTNILGGDTARQLDAIWQYLSYGRNVRAPSGIVLEPLPLIVGKEAVMLRRNYPDIGKRGIGVGYPAKVNLTFDAGQMRLGAIWHGDFVEASAAWRGQGSGAVRMMSREVIRFPAGAAFAVLENLQSSWPTNEARQLPDFQFKGYTLDSVRRPTFRYDFNGGLITDQFIDRQDTGGKGYLERRLTLTRLPDRTWFRLAVSGSLKNIDEKTVAVGRMLQIRFPSEPVIRGEELLLDLSGHKELKLEYRW